MLDYSYVKLVSCEVRIWVNILPDLCCPTAKHVEMIACWHWKKKLLNEILTYMTITIIAIAVVIVTGLLIGIYMTLRHKGELDLNADFKKGQLRIKKKKWLFVRSIYWIRWIIFDTPVGCLKLPYNQEQEGLEESVVFLGGHLGKKGKQQLQ